MKPIELVAEAITDRFIETGKWASVLELANFAGKSVAYVRKALRSVTPFTNNFDSNERSYNFRGYGFSEIIGKRGNRDTREYAPTRNMLRKRILEARK